MNLTFNPSNYWDAETQLFRVIPNLPIEAHGNILENTGKLLIYWSLIEEPNPMYRKVVDGLYGLLIDGILARTKYYGDYEPSESEPGRWVLIHGKGFYKTDIQPTYIDDKPTEWLRKDPSTEQIFYALAGCYRIWKATQYAPAIELFRNVVEEIIEDGWKLKIDGKRLSDGRFFVWFPPYREYGKWKIQFPLGNHTLGALALSEGRKSLPAVKWFHAWINLGLVNWWGMLDRFTDWSDRNNTSFILWFLQSVDERYKEKWMNWEIKQMETRRIIKERYHDQSNPEDEVKDCLNHVCRTLMGT